jgi:thioredoxin 1
MEKQLTDSNFEDETKSGLVLVDFWAPWCSPCMMLSPTIEEIANERNDVIIGKLNVDENPQVAEKLGVMSIPTVMLFKDGQLVETMIGFRPKETYTEVIDSHK